MDQTRKLTLILQLFSYFPTEASRLGFENLLRTARIVVNERTVRSLAAENRRQTLSRTHAWVRVMASGWEGQVALFAWYHESLVSTLSALGTLDQFVPVMRRCRKIVVVPASIWPTVAILAGIPPDTTWFDAEYQGVDENGNSTDRDALVIKLDAQPDFQTAIQLGVFLGTRHGNSIEKLPATQPMRPVNEDLRDTIEPPAPTLKALPTKPR